MAINNILGDETLFSRIVKSIVQECTAAEPTITRYDTICGDGDCGTTLLSGAQAMMNGLENGVIPASSISRGMQSLAEIVVNAMGGTSGAIYGIFLSAMAAAIAQDDEDSISFRMMVDAAQHAISTLMCFTGARVGDRTLMDALIPFMDELQASSQSKEGVAAVEAALQKAVKGCEGTRFLESRFGRSTYVNDEDSGQEENGGLPDPGACGIVAVLTGIVKGLS
jgi:dihydroxyacetone kinase